MARVGSPAVSSGRRSGTWKAHAACSGEKTEIFFADDTSYYPSREVQRMCDGCPVRALCLQNALDNGEHGVWGGTTKRQRDAMKRFRQRASCPSCGNEVVPSWDDETIQGCLGCGLTWPIKTVS